MLSDLCQRPGHRDSIARGDDDDDNVDDGDQEERK